MVVAQVPPDPTDTAAPPAVALGASVHGRVVTGDVTVTDVTYALPSGQRVAAYLVWRPAERQRPGPGLVLAHWGRPDGRRVLLNEAIDLAREGHRVVVPETPRPTGTDADSLARALDVAVATQRRALDVLTVLARADEDRLGLVGHEAAALPALVLAAAAPRVRAVVLDGYRGTGRLADDIAERCARARGHSRLLVQHRRTGSAADDDVRSLFDTAARPREWRAYDALDGTEAQVRGDRAGFLDGALRGDASDAAAVRLRRKADHLRDPDWWLRDRTTGERTWAPENTTPLLLWQLLVAVRVLGLAPGHEQALLRADLAVGGVWALDELVRGGNPARRVVGAGVLGAQAVRAGRAGRRL